jgi:hypothetical protein
VKIDYDLLIETVINGLYILMSILDGSISLFYNKIYFNNSFLELLEGKIENDSDETFFSRLHFPTSKTMK